jgi:asparagine synthase (glutamine-hydrolysing)
MCGIAGIAGFADPSEAVRRVRQMNSVLARRGPDGEGVESWADAVLGHRRLAIIDLSDAGRQPMLSVNGAIGVTFNGEIYNYRELRRELQSAACVFRTDSDTEVLLHGYRQWGIDMLVAKLRGMFALAIWDDRRRTLFLVRDRLGVKPLLYVRRGRTLAFASTIRALKATGFVSELDEVAVADFAEYGYINDQFSIYRDAVKLPAATLLEWRDGVVQQREYWAPPPVRQSTSSSFSETTERAEELLLDAVKARLHADVPVGVLLSGGIDSALVSWAITSLGHDLTAYTIGVPGDPWDESGMARATAQQIGIRHEVLEMSAQDEPRLEEIVTAYAEPFACASALGMLRISKAVSASVKVLLTGDGGDDVFLGYPQHRHLWIAGQLGSCIPAPLAGLWLRRRSSVPRLGALRRAAALLDYACGDLEGFTQDRASRALYAGNNLLGHRLADIVPARPPLNIASGGADGLVAGLLEFERRTRFVGEYMTKVDAATLHFAVEARSPFLDQYLWEFASALPVGTRLHGGTLKAVLRAIARRRIGKAVALRKKRGFGVPVHRWLTGRWRPLFEESFRDSLLHREGWIDADRVLAVLKSSVAQGAAPPQLWYLFVLELWLRYESTYTVSPDDAGRTSPGRAAIWVA